MPTGEFFGHIDPNELSIKEKLGKGAGGQVFRAVHTRSGIELAIKSINVYEREKRH